MRIVFTALSGALDDGGVPCYLLEIDDCSLLLDCGWDAKLDVSSLAALHPVIPRVDAVLLAQSDMHHLGALPYAISQLGLNAPVYATLPVCKMGQLTLYDAYKNVMNERGDAPFNLDDVDRACTCFVELKYSQKVKLSGRAAGVTIEPLSAGRGVGGTLWRVWAARC